uniref:chorismate mutase n=1 Tax=Salix viminalis TaxID=40686 RepID=A0A6N2NDV7_SALVM
MEGHQEDEAVDPMCKAEPNLAVNLYEDWIMPLTKEVQAEHLLRMLDSCQMRGDEASEEN